MTQKLLVLKGLPASGKSTYARNLLKKYPGQWVRTNKDDIRAMVLGGKWSRKKEKLVERIESSTIVDALDSGYSVVVDNTHLGGSHIERYKQLIQTHRFDNVEIEINDEFLAVRPEDCIKRDLERERSVGAEVIWRMYWQHVADMKTVKHSPNKKDAIIVDLDGTLASMNGRSAFEWEKVDTDTLHQHIRTIVWMYHSKGYKIIVLSGRDGCCRELTEDWLTRHGIEYETLLMRAEGDCRKDYIVKGEIYERDIEPYYNVFLVIDDRPQVLREWVRRGLPVVSANPTGREF